MHLARSTGIALARLCGDPPVFRCIHVYSCILWNTAEYTRNTYVFKCILYPTVFSHFFCGIHLYRIQFLKYSTEYTWIHCINTPVFVFPEIQCILHTFCSVFWVYSGCIPAYSCIRHACTLLLAALWILLAALLLFCSLFRPIPPRVRQYAGNRPVLCIIQK